MNKRLATILLPAFVGMCSLAYYAGDQHGRDAERERSQKVDETVVDKLEKYGIK